jgi:hypothetical protein
MLQRLIRPNPMRGTTSWTLGEGPCEESEKDEPDDDRKLRFEPRFLLTLLRLEAQLIADILNASVVWLCQIFCGSCMGNSLGMKSSSNVLAEPAPQDVLDPVNFHRDVRRR